MAHLYIIPGHGHGDPGAGGHGYGEAERVRALAQRIKDLAPDYVTLHDFNRNAYAQGDLNTLSIPKDWMVVELHMDAAAESAKGGHVIINSTFEPDWYDKALADGIAAYFPGRAQKIYKRDNLANPKRAAARGINYRLVENGFITNAGDVAKFNDLDRVAKIYLDAAGIPYGKAPDPVPETPHQVKTVESDTNDVNQYWFIRGAVKDGSRIAIRNVGTWEWLSDPNSSKKSTPAQCWSGCNDNADPRDPQWWTLHATDRPGVWTLSPDVAPHLRLDIAGNNANAGVTVQLYDANDSEAQRFVIYQDPDTRYRIVSVTGFKPIAVTY